MKIVFFGTPELSARVLQVLIESEHEIIGVVTQADKPQGRHQHMATSAVKKVAQEYLPGVPIFQPIKAREVEFIEQLRSLEADLFVVAAYGQILPQVILDLPRIDCINIHYSLLPLLRGAAPIQRSILEGHSQTGVSIMKMVLAMDAGPVYSMHTIPLDDEITSGELTKRLTAIAGPELLKVVQDLEMNRATLKEQEAALMTLAPKIETSAAEVDWKQPAEVLQRLIRAMDPFPGAWCEVKIRNQVRRLKLYDPKVVEWPLQEEMKPGQILCYGKRLVIACGQRALEIGKIQPEGKSSMSVHAWCNGQLIDDVSF